MDLRVQHCGRDEIFLQNLVLLVDFSDCDCEVILCLFFRSGDCDLKPVSAVDVLVTELLSPFAVVSDLGLQDLKLLLCALPVSIGRLFRAKLDHSVHALALATSRYWDWDYSQLRGLHGRHEPELA